MDIPQSINSIPEQNQSQNFQQTQSTNNTPITPSQPDTKSGAQESNSIDNLAKQLSELNTTPSQPQPTAGNIQTADQSGSKIDGINTEAIPEMKIPDTTAQTATNPVANTPPASVPGSSTLPALDSILGGVDDSSTPAALNEQGTQKAPESNKVNSARVLANFNAEGASMQDFLAYTIANDSSDLHLSAGNHSYIRVDGDLRPLQGEIMTSERIQKLILEIISEDELKKMMQNKELDMSYEHKSGNRFRINMFFNQGKLSMALRLIPNKIRSIAELKLPDILYEFTKIPHGLVLVTGPTGSGKSTSLAAMIQEINMSRAEHIVTIEDPIEYVYPRGRSLIEQRELGKDTLSWTNALRSVLRQDPNVVLVGEMRDHETIEATITVAETGHLVFATLHTNSASQSIDRMIDVFPEGQQSQIRAQLANVVNAVISQRLVPIKSGGRKAVNEIMIGNSAVRNAIREEKTYQIDNIIQTNTENGMQTMESSLAKLVKSGELSADEAVNYTVKPDELFSLLKSN
jgi:twitching motility protein PilT